MVEVAASHPGATTDGAIAEQITPAPPPAAASRHRRFSIVHYFRGYIAGKIIIPYLVLIFILGLGATYTTINLIAGSLEDKFREELANAGLAANQAMVKIESTQLTVLRQMSFTVGVEDAIAGADSASLQRLMAPIAANAQVPYLDVFNAAGNEVFAVRDPSLGPDAAQRLDPDARDWPPVRKVLDRVVDDRGDKHASIVYPPWGGAIFVTAGPVTQGDRMVGVVALSIPIDTLANRLSQEAGSKAITLYSPEGTVLTSSLAASPESLSAMGVTPAEAAERLRGESILVRRVPVDGRPLVETLGLLAIRREPVLLLGVGNLVTIIEDKGAETRQQMILIFSAVVILILAFGLYLARTITRPVEALVEATHRIRRNELDFDLPVTTEDETGVLTEAFNEMTGGLRERERSRIAITKYMSQKVYKLIQTGELGMGGVTREITVFDTDIRSFTSISETKTPDDLIAFLNRYFTRMVACVYKYDGEVDKFVGDAILAKFGATEWYPDHARRAVLCMIEMIEACDELDEELKAEGDWVIRMGVGCNSGPAVIGNLGSPERMEYTIISDVVNTAARAQELTKEYGWDLLISDATYEEAKDYIEVGEPWTLQLRGQTRDTYLYPVLGRKGDVSPRRRALYEDLKLHGRSIFADFYESTGITPVLTS
ncbi:MAG: HAMP domain-containing protein [Chloroflexi bacterium]|nr:HAMP domain-containing protein [Chloroflexota bacterium]